jgi:2-hydroxy-6-oxonona-2,4-dienedioate hydrolase
MLHGSGPGATGWANFNRNIDPSWRPATACC